jgi:hypothetical protein
MPVLPVARLAMEQEIQLQAHARSSRSEQPLAAPARRDENAGSAETLSPGS